MGHKFLEPLSFFRFYLLIHISLAIILNIFFGFNFSYYGITPIIGLLFFFSLGYRLKFKTKFYKPKILKIKKLGIIIVILNILVASAIFLFAFQNGLISSNFLQRAGELSFKRFSNELSLPLYLRFSNILLYSNLILSPLYFLSTKKKKGLLILMLSFVSSLIFSARAGFLLAIIIYISSFITFYLAKNKIFPKISLVLIKKILLILVLIILVFFPLIQVLRIGRLNDISYIIILENLTSHFFGSFNAFSIWQYESFDLFLDYSELTWGKYTFHGLYQLFFENLESGVFTDRTVLNENISTNVYTMFRGLFQDFGMFSFFIFFLIGILLKNIKTRLTRNYFSNSVILIMFYTTIIWSFVINPIGYTSILIGMLIPYFIFKLPYLYHE